MSKKSDLVQLGALWERESENGNVYFSGKFDNAKELLETLQSIENLEDYRLQAFPQKDKENAKRPDITITFSKFTPQKKSSGKSAWRGRRN